ncbi:unnamed protein product, partial [Symbiodinium microadriaticum]
AGAGTPIPSGVPGLLAAPQPVAAPGAVQQSVETQLLIHTVQEQQKQISQMVSLVETLVSRDSVRESKGKGVGSLSDLSGSSMDVDEGGAPIRNPKAESYVPKLPALDGSKMTRGRKAEIEAWVEYLEIFLPWLALFDDRIPGEIQSHFGQETTVQNSRLSKGESVRGLDLLKQVEKEQLGVPAGYEAMRRLHQELSVCSRIEASSLREEILRFTTPKAIANRPLEVFRCVQVELAKFQRLTAGFPDLALTEGKGDEKGKTGKGNKGDQEKDKGKHQGAAATSSKDGAEEPKTPPQDPDGEYVEVVVEVEPTPPPKVAPTPPKVAPTPPKVAPTPPKGTSVGKGHQKGVGRAKGKGSVAKAAGSGKLDSNMPKTKAQPKQPQVKAAPKILSAPSSSSKTPAKAVNLVPKGVRKVHLKARPDSLRSNPPLGRRWSAYPRKCRGKQQKGPQKVKTETKGTQTPEIMTMVGHMERHEKLEEEAKKFAQLLEAQGNPSRFQARFPQVDLNIEAGRADIVTRSMVELTDRTSYTSPGPAPRQHPPPPPPPDVTMVDPAGTVPGSPSSFSFVTAPKTPDAGTAAVETPAPLASSGNCPEHRQEGEDRGTARHGHGGGIGLGTSISTSDQVGNADSQSNLPSRAPTSSWGYLGRSVKECDHKRPCAMVSFASPLPPTISVQDDANGLPVA